FPYVVAHVPFGAMARDIVEAYPGEELMAHPVGTGPYVLKSWTRRSKIVLEANPDYRGFVWDFQASDEPWDQALIAAMKGKQMPQVGRVEITIIEEPQSVWLAFLQKELDYINVPPAFAPNAFDGDKLKPGMAHAARRQAAGDSSGRAAQQHRSRVQRAVAALGRADRRQDGLRCRALRR